MLFCPFIPLTKLEPTRARLCFSSNHDESWTTLLVELKIFQYRWFQERPS